MGGSEMAAPTTLPSITDYAIDQLVTPQKRRSARMFSGHDKSRDEEYDSGGGAYRSSPLTNLDSTPSSSYSISSSPSETTILTPRATPHSKVAHKDSLGSASPFRPGASNIKRIKLNVTPTKIKAGLKLNVKTPGEIQGPTELGGRERIGSSVAYGMADQARGSSSSTRINPATKRSVSSNTASSVVPLLLSPPSTPASHLPGHPNRIRTTVGAIPIDPFPFPSGSTSEVSREYAGTSFTSPTLTYDGSQGSSSSISSGFATPGRHGPGPLSCGTRATTMAPATGGGSITLPPHLHTLLLLNNALDLALSLHMAMHPPLLPPASARSTSEGKHVIDLPDTANFINLKNIIEQTCSRRFGLAELRRLVWIWAWDGVLEEKAGDQWSSLGGGRKRKRSGSVGGEEDDEGIRLASEPATKAARPMIDLEGKDSDEDEGIELGAEAQSSSKFAASRAMLTSLKEAHLVPGSPVSRPKPPRNPFLVEEDLEDDEEGSIIRLSPTRARQPGKTGSRPLTTSTPPRFPTLSEDQTDTIAFPYHALSHIISAARTVDPATNRRVYTYGLGIRVALTAAEALEIGVKAPAPPTGPVDSQFTESPLARRIATREKLTRTDAAGEVTFTKVQSTTRWVGRWSAGAEGRSKEVARRLWDWVERGSPDRSAPVSDAEARERAILYTPSSSTGTTAMAHPLDHIPQIPMASLPALPSSPSGLPPAFVLPGLSRQPQPSLGLGPTFGSPSPRKPSTAASGSRGHARHSSVGSLTSIGLAAETDVFGPVKGIPQKQAAPGSVADRRQAMYDRIKARQGGRLGAPSAVGGKFPSAGLHANMSASERQIELKRMSTLSRLESVAEGVWMFFSVGPAGGAGFAGLGSPGSPKARRRACPMHEVVEIVVKSSKTPISSAEAKDSLALLTELCPTFLIKRVISRQEWLEMPAQNQVVPASPKKQLVGPASPGKVTSRTMGLREVRERIRKELGEQYA